MEQVPTKEYTWLTQHPEVEEKYLGEWIAIHDSRVIAHGRDLNTVLRQTAHLDPPPHVTYVEEAGLAAYALYLFL